MRRNKQIFWFITILLFFSLDSFDFPFFFSSIHGNEAQKNSSIDLPTLLEKCAEYAERLSNASLYFVCKEKIKEEIYDLKGSRTTWGMHNRIFDRNEFIYDYQVIRKNNQSYEKRVLVKENGEDRNIDFAQLKTKIFWHKNILFGPVGLIGEKWQQFFKYEIIGKKRFEAEDVIVIKAVPKPEVKLNKLYGRLWICTSDFSVIKIEWDQRSVNNFEEAIEMANKFNAWPRFTLISEYKYVKNGLRFPSKYFVKEDYLDGRGRRFSVSSKTVTYDDYRFFTVETEIKH